MSISNKSDIELLQYFYGEEAESVYEGLGCSLRNVLRETSQHYSPRNDLLHAARELQCRALLEGIQGKECFSSPGEVKKYLSHKIGFSERELFYVLFLDSQNRLILAEELFQGTATECTVHPREIIKRALQCNSSGIIISHNHPSGQTTPSQSDIKLTQEIKDVGAKLAIKLLDHFIVGGGTVISMAERGLV